MDKPSIKINCKGAVNIRLDELTQLQGDLKELSEANFRKLKSEHTQERNHFSPVRLAGQWHEFHSRRDTKRPGAEEAGRRGLRYPSPAMRDHHRER